MGSYSELYFANTSHSPKLGELSEESPYLLAKYHIPLLWLALFDRNDIIDLPVPDDPGCAQAYLVAPRTKAITTLATRRGMLLSHFPGLDPRWFALFVSMLEQTPFEFVHADTSEVAAMVGTEAEWRRDLELILGLFDAEPHVPAPSGTLLARLFAPRMPAQRLPGWHLLDKYFHPLYQKGREAEPWAYCGQSGTDTPMPWEPPA